MKKLIQIFILILMLFLLACTSTTIDDNVIDITTIGTSRGNIYQRDLVYFVQKLKEIHPAFTPNEYAYVYNDSFKKLACDIYDELGKSPFKEGESESNRFKFCYLATKLLSKVKDNHSRFPIIHYFFGNSDKTLPIIARWFEDKLYIIDTIDKYDFLKNKEITKIDSIEVNIIKPKINEFISGDNEYFKNNINGLILCRRNALELLNLVSYDKVEIEYIDNGQIKKETLEFKKWKGYKNKIEEFLKGNIGRKEEFFSNGEEIWFREFKEYNTMYVQSNIFLDKNSFMWECRKLLQEVKENNIKNIVIDLRSNVGGSTYIFENLIGKYFIPQINEILDSFFILIKPSDEWFLSDGLDPDNYQDEINSNELSFYEGGTIKDTIDKTLAFNGNLYILIGSMTLSGSTIFSSIIKDNKLGILIGEPTGNASTFFAGGDITTVTLPNSVTTINISCAMYVRTNEEARLKEPDAIYPDVYTPTTFEDYINGKDPCWEYLVENVFNKQEN